MSRRFWIGCWALTLLFCTVFMLSCDKEPEGPEPTNAAPVAVAERGPLVVNASSPNNVLAQLGVDGVTAIGGDPMYSNFLISLDANGAVPAAAMPAAAAHVVWTSTVFVDSVAGTDGTPGNGTAGRPYKTIVYAVTQAGNQCTVVLAPGTYPGGTINNTLWNDICIRGLDPDYTTITILKFYKSSSPANVSIDLYGVHVGTLQQANNRTLTVGAYDRTTIDTLSMVYTAGCTLYRDPTATVTLVPGSAFTNVYAHASTGIGYTPSATNNWDTVPILVGPALDSLAAYTRTFSNNLVPIAVLTGGADVEQGSTVTNAVLTWTLNSVATTRDISGGGTNVSLGSGVAGTWTHTNALFTTNMTYTISVSRGGYTNTATTAWTFKDRLYYGFNNVTNVMLDADILALSNSVLATAYGLSATNLTPVDTQFVWVCYPVTFGTNPVLRLNGLVVAGWQTATDDFVNAYGGTTNYIRLRSPQLYAAPTLLEIN